MFQLRNMTKSKVKVYYIMTWQFNSYLFQFYILSLEAYPGESFDKEFNLNESETFRNLFPNHSEPIRKTFWISYHENRSKIHPS